MSYHPYGNVKNRHASSRARGGPNFTSQIVTPSLNPGPSSSASASTVVHDQPPASLAVHRLPSREEIDRKMYEADLAWQLGRINTSEYGAVLRSCLAERCARWDRLKIAHEQIMRGEDPGMQELMGLTDSQMAVRVEQADRRIKVKAENERRSEARMLRRTVTRGL